MTRLTPYQTHVLDLMRKGFEINLEFDYQSIHKPQKPSRAYLRKDELNELMELKTIRCLQRDGYVRKYAGEYILTTRGWEIPL